MAQLILKGIVTGLILSVMIGPAFFILLETSIKKGIRAALSFDAGVLVADIIYIIVAYVFIQQVAELAQGNDNAIVRAVGGVLFLVYGIITYFRKIKTPSEKNPDWEKIGKESKGYLIHFLKGVFLNLANPLVIFYWFSVMAFGRTGNVNTLSFWEMFVFLLVVLGTFFCIDVVKIVGAKKLRPYITTNFLASINRITGSILIVFGVFLIINSIVLWIR